MSRKYIATLLHKAMELAPDDEILRVAATLPHYVIDRRLVDMLGREDVQRSISAMVEAKVAHLPFPDLLMEFDAENGIRRFCALHEATKGFTADQITLAGDVLSVSIHQAVIDLTPTGLAVRLHAGELDGLAAGFSAAVALLMLNTAGIDKEVIDPVRLNAIRQARGLHAIPRHTVLHIGTVVDRDGRAIPADQCRHMPVHLRAGHCRHQHFGKEWAMTKIVYIPPTLVNFRARDDASSVPQPKRVLTC